MLSRSEIAEKLATVYLSRNSDIGKVTVGHYAFVLGIRDLFGARVDEMMKGKEDGK